MSVLKHNNKAIIVKDPTGAKKILSYQGTTQTGTKYITTTDVVDVRTYAKAQVKDENLKPENIKKGVTILGIEGTYEGE